MSKWQEIEAYPDKGRRDEKGKWIDEAGAPVDLLMADGQIIKAQWRGERTRGGGEAWAWWPDDENTLVGIGLYQPKAW